MTATPSLSVSLAAKPNDPFKLIFPTRDSVIFSTGRHKFDMNVLDKKKRHSENQGRCSCTASLPVGKNMNAVVLHMVCQLQIAARIAGGVY